MIQYIFRDLIAALQYLPFGLLIGIPLGILLLCFTKKDANRRQRILPMVVFGFYLAVILTITFLSRESGTRKGLDLELFSTWGINARNNAYVIENVLLFVPYGFVCCWAFKWARGFLCCTLLGAVTSLTVECLQLLTQRGYFQIDDILTNILGSVIGWLVFRLFFTRRG